MNIRPVITLSGIRPGCQDETFNLLKNVTGLESQDHDLCFMLHWKDPSSNSTVLLQHAGSLLTPREVPSLWLSSEDKALSQSLSPFTVRFLGYNHPLQTPLVDSSSYSGWGKKFAFSLCCFFCKATLNRYSKGFLATGKARFPSKWTIVQGKRNSCEISLIFGFQLPANFFGKGWILRVWKFLGFFRREIQMVLEKHNIILKMFAFG